MAAQDDPTPWPLDSEELSSTISTAAEPSDIKTLHGRGYFSQLGVVRRKPCRADAPPTLSKSCSDKLSMKQSTSLLSSATSLLISPSNAYLHTLILPSSQYSETGCDRAFGPQGRMKSVVDREWEGGYSFQPFHVGTTTREFSFARDRVRNGDGGGGKTMGVQKPCGVSVVYTPFKQETLVNGIVQGRRQGDPRGASMVCRRGMWRATVEVMEQLKLPDFVDVPGVEGGPMNSPGKATLSIAESVPKSGKGEIGKDEGIEEEENCETAARRSEEELEEMIVDQATHLGTQEQQHERQTTNSEKKSTKTYAEFKKIKLLQYRKTVKDQTMELALKGWVKNVGDDSFWL
ncbi:MAG: hypothetical protein M1823_004556 [Watsoniomyces obsoletus]|nr:MAG: hypothetical protein M1823_004556 [Watsoniomyces obsoletus]